MIYKVPQRLKFASPVAIVAGGDTDLDLLADVLKYCPPIAADGGANTLLEKLNVIPRAVIGDLDSLSVASKCRLDKLPPKKAGDSASGQIIKIADQNYSDLEKCLCHVEAPLYLVFGALGGRLDHLLSAIDVGLRRSASKKLIFIDHDDCISFLRGDAKLELPAQERISVVCYEEMEFSACDGLEYSLLGQPFSLGTRVSLSNVANGPIRLSPDQSYCARPYSIITAKHHWPRHAAMLGASHLFDLKSTDMLAP